MKYTKFNSPVYKWLVVAFIGILLVWNLFLLVYYMMWIGLLPVTIQGVLILLILKQHQYTKLVIKWWAMIFLIISSSLQLAGRFLQDVVNNFIDMDVNYYGENGIRLIIGILIFIYAGKTLEVVEKEEPAILQHD